MVSMKSFTCTLRTMFSVYLVKIVYLANCMTCFTANCMTCFTCDLYPPDMPLQD
jgi:hypothetical protein